MKATFGAGCFWGVEETFRVLNGVEETAVGFMGGNKANPTYEQTTTGETGHAEVVHLEYDPEKISYEKLLEVFFENHDATQVDRQGPDVGNQYRSVIFYHTEEQRKLAEKAKEKIDKVVTKIEKASEFFKAEDYHQKYLQKRGLKVCPPK